MTNEFDAYRERFVVLYETIKKLHISAVKQNMGHGIDHDITVATLAILISPDDRTAEKSWCAALLHSVDRLLDTTKIALLKETLADIVKNLPSDYFTKVEVDEIVRAALQHSDLNRNDQSITQQVLMDADRLSNLMLTTVIRAAQFRPNISAFEFKYLNGEINPTTTYHSPLSVIDSLRKNISEYIPQLRLPVAKKMAEEYVKELKGYIRSVEMNYEELGLNEFVV